MELEEALEIADRCEFMPIDTLEFADMCITALKISLDATDVAVFGPTEAAVSISLVALLGGFVLRQAFKVSRLQGEFDAYRSGKS